MFILPGLLALVIFIYARPFDFIPALRGQPFLYLFFGLAVFGFLIDLRQGKSRITPSPHWLWVVAFYVWCVFTAAVKGPDSLAKSGLNLTIAVSIYFLIAFGLSSFKALEAFAATILACTLFISAVCVHQGLQPFQCVAVRPTESLSSLGRPDGRPCEDAQDCFADAPDPEAAYRCEEAGLFGITSIGNGRVRYVGVLQDPNEASMAVAIGVPLAFAFFQRKRTPFRFAVALLAFLLASITVVMSKSRGGQLVFLAVLSVYFLKRYRMKGLLIAAIAALPVLAMGGREGGEADSSSLERIENLMVGVQLFGRWPVLGVGFGRFTEYHPLTAHNSYVLAAAELGLPGMIVWLSIMFASFKTVVRSSTLVIGPEGNVARIWGLALLSALVGLSVGIFFLSFNYHYVLWIYIGMTGALAGAVTHHLPTFRIRVTPREVGLLTLFGLLLLLVIFVYATIKLRYA
jgi:hypothetical protein